MQEPFSYVKLDMHTGLHNRDHNCIAVLQDGLLDDNYITSHDLDEIASAARSLQTMCTLSKQQTSDKQL